MNGMGATGIYSSSRDLVRFVAALLGGGANEHGSMLKPATLATMFEPQYQPDPRVPGLGLAFFRSDAGGHRVVGHEGILPGFNSEILAAPDDGVALIALTNGSSGAMAWMPTELRRLLHDLLDVPHEVVRTDIPQHPEIWGEICGRYQLPRRISDLRGRVMMGGGVEVFVRGGQLMVRVLAPMPALYGGLPLHPDDEQDPYVFRLDLSRFGMATFRIVFSREARVGPTAHADLGGQPLSLVRRPPRGGRTPGSPERLVRLWWPPLRGRFGGAARDTRQGRHERLDHRALAHERYGPGRGDQIQVSVQSGSHRVPPPADR
jgi:hypothetical protein